MNALLCFYLQFINEHPEKDTENIAQLVRREKRTRVPSSDLDVYNFLVRKCSFVKLYLLIIYLFIGGARV
jgi:hypothetical protein